MTDLMAKDHGLAVSAASETRVPVVVAPAAQQLYRIASSHGQGRERFLIAVQIPETVERRHSGLIPQSVSATQDFYPRFGYRSCLTVVEPSGVAREGYRDGSAMFAPPLAKDQTRTAAGPIGRQAAGSFRRTCCEQESKQVAEYLNIASDRPATGLSPCLRNFAIWPPDRGDRPRTLSPPIASLFPVGSQLMQAKLAVGRTDDPLEHEADRIADELMRLPDPGASIAAAPLRLRPKCAACEDETRTLQPKAAQSAEAGAGEAPSLVREVLRAPGQPLDTPMRAFFGARFGHDFSAVRVHTDARAAASARLVNALAYTVGQNIVFGAGQYAPGTREAGGYSRTN